jgi:hypothetical protein
MLSSRAVCRNQPFKADSLLLLPQLVSAVDEEVKRQTNKTSSSSQFSVQKQEN